MKNRLCLRLEIFVWSPMAEFCHEGRRISMRLKAATLAGTWQSYPSGETPENLSTTPGPV